MTRIPTNRPRWRDASGTEDGSPETPGELSAGGRASHEFRPNPRIPFPVKGGGVWMRPVAGMTEQMANILRCTCNRSAVLDQPHTIDCLVTAFTQPHAMVNDDLDVFYPDNIDDAQTFAVDHHAWPLDHDQWPFGPEPEPMGPHWPYDDTGIPRFPRALENIALLFDVDAEQLEQDVETRGWAAHNSGYERAVFDSGLAMHAPGASPRRPA